MEDIEVERIFRTTDTSDDAVKLRLRACRAYTGFSVKQIADSLLLTSKEIEAQERLEPHCHDLARYYYNGPQLPFDFIYGGETDHIDDDVRAELLEVMTKLDRS
ncbi:hypothetical protein PhaeoP30_01862 [Phaeobacter inhibens]|uniref:hypothetical protein n=1 Tax=Phaeobacter inhibens TaxID=221822 RepID=UPI000C9BD34F|nr:hypothetical protein [Phaeobacter inhibens]AUQ58777.1 hypothetical protein PhaeoP30_01862 [Phaeobacter inhibens]